MGNGENVQRENKLIFFQSIWYSNHILISPLVDLGLGLVDEGLVWSIWDLEEITPLSASICWWVV